MPSEPKERRLSTSSTKTVKIEGVDDLLKKGNMTRDKNNRRKFGTDR